MFEYITRTKLKWDISLERLLVTQCLITVSIPGSELPAAQATSHKGGAEGLSYADAAPVHRFPEDRAGVLSQQATGGDPQRNRETPFTVVQGYR